jgi:hypothetical protein
MSNVILGLYNTEHTFYIQQPFPENHAVYEIMWKKYGAATETTFDNIIRTMRFAYWIAKATHTQNV